jgi:ATP-dependent Lhr-like helicase
LKPAEMEEALRELAGRGLVTSDAFAAIRSLVRTRRVQPRSRIAGYAGMAAPAGRWSLFPGRLGAEIPHELYLEHWCHLLLRRYGILLRDVLKREAAAPSWRELVPVLRRMELRGEVRGGRFIRDVAGEQFAEEADVERLRADRDADSGNDWVIVSAADPLNLSGIIAAGPRVPATHKNAVVFLRGRCVAARQRGCIEFFESVEPATADTMQQALRTGRRPDHSDERPAWTTATRRAEIRDSWLADRPVADPVKPIPAQE